MKKSKLFILLPLVALTLTGCNNTVVSETTSEAVQESETTGINGYSSYTLEFSFYYSGDKSHSQVDPQSIMQERLITGHLLL